MITLREAKRMRALVDAHIRAQIACALAGKDVPAELLRDAERSELALQQFVQSSRWTNTRED